MAIAFVFIKVEYIDRAPSVICIYDEGNNQSAIYVNSKLVGKVNGDASIKNNMDKSIYYIVSDKEIHILNGKKLKKVGDKLKFVAVANHSEEALLMDTDNALYIYRKDKLEKITDKDINMAAISGNGKYYSYSTDEAAYFGTDSNNEKEVLDVMIPYISEDGEYIYAFDYDKKGKKELDEGYGSYYFEAFSEVGSFYLTTGFDLLLVNKDGTTDVLMEAVAGITGLNADGTEILCHSDEGSSVCVNGTQAQNITENLIQSIYYYDNKNTWNGNFYAIDSFVGAICEVADIEGNSENRSICTISKEYKALEIVNNSYNFVGISESMKKVFYMDKDSDLYRVDAKEGAESELLAEDVYVARISPDGKDVYFTRKADAEVNILYHIENGLKEKEIAWVYDFFDIIVYDDYCYLEANDIYYIKNDKMTKLENLDLECFFIDYMSQKVYGYTKNAVYEIKGVDKKKLEGEFKENTGYTVGE